MRISATQILITGQLVQTMMNSDSPLHTSTVYPFEELIPVTDLRLDTKNPRLPDVQKSQVEAIHTMAKVEQDKLIALAAHIVSHGLNPADRFIVIPDDDNSYAVLDGNRRLTVLRALNSPDLITDLLSEKSTRQLKRLAEQFSVAPVTDVYCVVFADRQHADTWIELLHDGESGGAGLVRWSAQQRSRYHSRKGQKPYHLQILDFVAENGELSELTRERISLGRFPSSTLQRLLGTPYVRDKLGIDKINGEAVVTFPKSEVLKGLTRVIEDIGSGAIKVDSLMRQTDRINYINRLDSSELPDSAKRIDATSLEDAPEESVDNSLDQNKPRERRHSTSRKCLVPSRLRLEINVARLNDIYIELKRRLVVGDTPNAVAVLLRAFFEMSIDEYIDKNKIKVDGRATLASKGKAVADYMQHNSVLSQHELRPIRRALDTQTDPYSTTTLHSYVHNRRVTPGPNELKATWDTLEIFMVKMWE